MRAAFLAFLAYAIIALAAPISVPVSSTEVSTDSAALSSTSVSVATASLTSTAAVPAPSSSSVSSTPSSGAQHDDDDGDDTQDEDEDDPDDDEDEDGDEPDEDENEPDENDEDEDKQDEDDDDDGDDSDSDDDCEDDVNSDSDSGRSHEKFRVEFEIDAKTARPFLSSILQPADAHLDVKLDLDASKVGGLLTVLLGDLNRVLDDAANLVEIGGDSEGRGGFVNGSPQSQNGTLTTQTSRSASPSADFSGDSEGKITLRARTRLHGNHNDN